MLNQCFQVVIKSGGLAWALHHYQLVNYTCISSLLASRPSCPVGLCCLLPSLLAVPDRVNPINSYVDGINILQSME